MQASLPADGVINPSFQKGSSGASNCLPVQVLSNQVVSNSLLSAKLKVFEIELQANRQFKKIIFDYQPLMIFGIQLGRNSDL